MDDQIQVNEIFRSFQGESTLIGHPTLFIRLSGCNLRCSICDTKRALKNGSPIKTKELVKIIRSSSCKHICITGGEPLLQSKQLKKLVKQVLCMNKIISIETNGSIPINLIDKKIKRVVDVKTPSTKENGSFLMSNIGSLTKNDELKFVISDKNDFDYAIQFINSYKIPCTVLFSPNLKNKQLAKKLIQWILKSNKDIVFQPQLHKLIKEKPIYILRQNRTQLC